MYTLQKKQFRKRLFKPLFVALTSFGILMTASVAHAACGDHLQSSHGISAKLPLALLQRDTSEPSSRSIVGLWHVIYSSQGQLFYEAFDQWHGDGTEFENANFIPTEGNICVGVWKLMGNTVVLNHIGWNFDASGNSSGTFTLTERNVVGSDGRTYRGIFDYKVFDVNGNLIDELTGTQIATRITVR